LRPVLERIVGGARPVELLTTCTVTDGAAFGQLAKELGIPFRAPATWQEVVGELRTASVVVSNRLHVLILGMFAQVALVPVTDRKKLEAFARDAAMPYLAARMDDVNLGLLEEAIADSAHVVERAQAYAAATLQRDLGPRVD
jgi:polysaccharide pyruvyl transferase WcaK-like protein